MDLTDEVIEYARAKGADLVGIASADFFESKIEEHRRPSYFVPEAKSVVSIALKVNDAILDFGLSSNGDLYSPRHEVYTQTLEGYLKHYNYDQLDYLAVETSRYLENLGYKSFPIQARVTDWIEVRGIFPHKVAAVGGGLGTLGKCSLVVTPKYGPRIRLVSVITEAHLRPSGPSQSSTEEICGECSKCIEVCPINALSYSKDTGTTIVDKMRCWKLTLPGRCGLCMAICPYGRRSRLSLP
jgi:epoxyqueuosine reductase QueG